jgi:hypothetical protein
MVWPDAVCVVEIPCGKEFTGGKKFAGPVEISATGFVPLNENNRPGLLLLNDVIYIGFGSVGDFKSWHGFVFGSFRI